MIADEVGPYFGQADVRFTVTHYTPLDDEGRYKIVGKLYTKRGESTPFTAKVDLNDDRSLVVEQPTDDFRKAILRGLVSRNLRYLRDDLVPPL